LNEVDILIKKLTSMLSKYGDFFLSRDLYTIRLHFEEEITWKLADLRLYPAASNSARSQLGAFQQQSTFGLAELLVLNRAVEEILLYRSDAAIKMPGESILSL